MSKLKPKIHDEDTRVDYILAGDYWSNLMVASVYSFSNSSHDLPIAIDLLFRKIKDRLPIVFGKRSMAQAAINDYFSTWAVM